MFSVGKNKLNDLSTEGRLPQFKLYLQALESTPLYVDKKLYKAFSV